jgi:hypothetical protein
MERQRQAEALGAAPEVAQAVAARDTARIEVFPENWQAVSVFVRMGTQWRRAGLKAMPTGLDYAALPVVARACGVKLTGLLLDQVRTLEGEALRAMAS